jgi:DDE superfamily endonuclease
MATGLDNPLLDLFVPFALGGSYTMRARKTSRWAAEGERTTLSNSEVSSIWDARRDIIGHHRRLARHTNVHFHYNPHHASWLNQNECWFSIMSRQALQGANFTSVTQVRRAIDKFVASYNEPATPFEWTKRSL